MDENLNSKQKLAVMHIEGPALVIAGAGSGKTRVVTSRIAHLLSLGVPSNKILAVTFTNKAAEEMGHRIERLRGHSILACTFHSLGARILRESIHHMGYKNDFTIYDADDSEKLLKECFLSLGLKEDKSFFKQQRAEISKAKNALLPPQALDPDIRQIYELYQARLKNYHAVDFDDLLYLPIQLFHQCPEVLKEYQNRWSFILIDEYQDTNEAQHRLIQLISASHGNVFAVGDPDQSIYSWRGANVNNILHFERDFPGTTIITLDQNYRSRSTILEAANGLIMHNPCRLEKKLWSDRGVGEKVTLYRAENDRAEALFVATQIKEHLKAFSLNDCVIFYRTNFQSRIFEDILLKFQLPYIIFGGISFYQRREIKDILSLLRIVLAGSDFIAFSRTINIPKRGFGAAALEKLQNRSISTALPIFDCCKEVVENTTEIKLTPRQKEGLKEYVDMILSLREMVKAKTPLHNLIAEAISRSHYEEYLKEDPETFEEKKENITELVSKAAEWEIDNPEGTLSQFLEELALKESSDTKIKTSDTIRMMTLHNSKGLEFPVVFMVGMEEGLFPHANSKQEELPLQEERRLCYVGMTRAKEFLYLTAAKSRFLWGSDRSMPPSRFLSEIPSNHLHEPHLKQTKPTDGYALDFSLGDTVFHQDFGSGIVHKCYTTSLGVTYDIFFHKLKTIKSLVAKYARLTPFSS
jgi:DNA helicase II / ATP-dependent DNA helicase PcrA